MNAAKTILAAMALLLAAAPARAGEVIERIVAVVGDEVVLMSDLEAALDALVAVNRGAFDAQARAAGLNEGERDEWIRKQLAGQAPGILEQLIRDKIVAIRAKSLGISVTESQIDEQIDAFMETRGTSTEQLKAQLASQGYGWDEYREEVRLRIVETQVQHRVARGVQVSEADERALYNQEYAGGGPAEVRLRLLFLRGDDVETQRAAEKKARALLAKIRGGADFGAVAAENTQGPAAAQGGDVGFIKAGQMIAEVEAAAFALAPGEVSDVIKTAQGVFIVQAVEKRGGADVAFEDVREKIRERIFSERAQKAFSAWIAEQQSQLHIERRL